VRARVGKKQEIKSMKEVKPAILMFIAFTILCGGIYPAIVTGVASIAFPKQSAGSFITDITGKIAGSSLIGQPFADPRYFWPRPSATTDFGYNPMASGGSNLGPTNPDYLKSVGERVKALHEAGISGNVPADLVQSSASGLDPNISPEAAKIQIPRVAKARGINEEAVQKLVSARTEERQLGFLGEPRVNVLLLNLALDKEHNGR
jgi:potassium-transporting ATPase KdpC subunit